MNKQAARRARAYWLDREGEDEDYRPKLREVLTDQPLSETETYSLKEDGHARY